MQIFEALGFSVSVYAFARLLHYAYLRLEDSNRHPVLQKILLAVCFILWLLSFPVSVVLGVLNTMHFNRLRDIMQAEYNTYGAPTNVHRDSSISAELIAVILLIILIAVTIQSPSKEDLQYEYDAGYETGYESGYSAGYDESQELVMESWYTDGYEDGYGDGHADGYDEGYSIGYGHAVIDYCDKGTQDKIISDMLEFNTYTEIHEWIVSHRLQLSTD